MVGRLIEQQKIGVGEQRGGEGDPHAPAAGEFLHRALLCGFVEAEAGKDGGGARRGGLGADGDQAFVDFGDAGRVGVFGFVQEGQAFGVALQHGVEQGGGAGRGFLRYGGEAGARRQADISPVEREVAGDGAQQGGFAGAVAADQADAAAGIDREVGGIKESAAAEADGDCGDGQEGHGGRVIGLVGGGGHE